jgi:hypothetical protein
MAVCTSTCVLCGGCVRREEGRVSHVGELLRERVQQVKHFFVFVLVELCGAVRGLASRPNRAAHRPERSSASSGFPASGGPPTSTTGNERQQRGALPRGPCRRPTAPSRQSSCRGSGSRSPPARPPRSGPARAGPDRTGTARTRPVGLRRRSARRKGVVVTRFVHGREGGAQRPQLLVHH